VNSAAKHTANSLIAYTKQEDLRACFVGDEPAISRIIRSELANSA
jgi:hypothetical protein